MLFINAGGEPVAFHVDRIQNRLEIIVKNVNRQVLNIPGISDATILGDGRVVPAFLLMDFRLILIQDTTQALIELKMASLSLIFPLRIIVVLVLTSF